MIADDEVFIRILVRRTLHQKGHEVIAVENGAECIKKAQKELPDLILLDIMMPGIDGLETCEKLKDHRKTRNIPVMMLTSKGQIDDIRLALDCGADDYIVKPFPPEELEKTILRKMDRLKEE